MVRLEGRLVALILRVEGGAGVQTVPASRLLKLHLNRWPFSSLILLVELRLRWVVVAKLANPAVDLLFAGEGWQNAHECLKWVPFRTYRPEHGIAVLNDKIDLIARL